MRHALIRSLVRHFAEQAGYTGPLRVFSRIESFERVRKQRGYSGPTDEMRDLGATLAGRPPAVLINLGLHRSVAKVALTCAHEAVHVADPGLRHGPEFDRRVRRLIRGWRL